MRNVFMVASLVVCLVALAGSAGATEYKIDPEHTTVAFRVRQLFTSVEGLFDKFEDKIAFDAAAYVVK